MADYEDNKQKNSFTLFNNETGKSYELPVIKGTDGPDVLDIRKLYQQTGMFTYDPGFTSTASCDSSITYIDGNKGVLEQSPYDRILVTAAPAEIPRDLIDQLAINGIMVIPVGNQSEVQYLYRIKKLNDDEITKDKILPVYFVPLIKS